MKQDIHKIEEQVIDATRGASIHPQADCHHDGHQRTRCPVEVP